MSRVVRSLAACVMVAAMSVGVVVHGQQTRLAPNHGRSLAEALADLRSRGLKIIYSSEVVRPDMRVATEPRVAPLRRILDDILSPHGLIAQDGPAGSVLVVKNPRVRIEKRTPTSALPNPPQPAGQTAGGHVEIPRFVETVDVTGSQTWGAGVGPPDFTLQPIEVRSFAGGSDNVFRTLHSLPGVAGTDELGSRITVRGGAPDQNLTILDGIEIHNPYRIYVPSEDLGMAGLASAFNLDMIERVELSPGAFDVRHGDRLSSLLVVSSREGSSAEAIQGMSFVSLTDANVTMEGKLPRRAKGSWLVSARRTHFDLVAERVVEGALPAFHDAQAKVTWHPRAGQRISLFGVSGRERIRAGDTIMSGDEIHSTRTRNGLAALTFESSLGQRASARTIASFATLDDASSAVERSLSNGRGANTEASIDTGELVEFQLARNVAVDDLAIRQEVVLRSSDRHALDLGFDAHWLDTRWAWRIGGDRNFLQANGSSVRLGAGLPAMLDSTRESHRLGAWLQDRVPITPHFVLQPGVRVDRSSLTGETAWSPRLSASLTLGAAMRLSGALRLHSQTPGYEKLFQSDYFVDLSQRAATSLRAERALHAVVGLQRAFRSGVSVRLDGYYRRFTDLLVGRLETEDERLQRLAGYDVPPSLLVGVPTRAEITTSPVNDGTGRAYGVELQVSRVGGASAPLTGWASYAFGRADRTTYGVTSPFDYDRRHAVSLAANLKIGPRIDVSATGRWGTGFPRTPVRGVRLALVADTADLDGDGNRDERVPTRDALGNPMYQPDRGGTSNINTARLPTFSRIDLRLSYRPPWSRERWAFYLDVLNVLNRKNLIVVDSALAFDPRSDRPGIVEVREDHGIPFFPSFGIRFWF